MKKTIVLVLVILAVCLTFAACGCEHQYQETITTEASCSAVGMKTFTCTKCNDSYTEEIPMTEHAYGTAAVTKAATCTEEGEKSKACKVCGITKIVGSVPKLQHQYNSEVTKESTCTVKGTKTFTCATCSHTYTEEIAKIDHTYTSKVTTEATCTNAGVKTYTCKVCSDSYTEAVSAKGHSYTKKTNSSATCTSAGSATHTCKVCGNSYTETIAAKGHNWVNATCTKEKYCSRCKITSGNALGHTTQDGTCGRCGEKISIADKCSLAGPSLPTKIIHVACFSEAAGGSIWQSVRSSVEKVTYSFRSNNDGTVDLTIVVTGVCEYKYKDSRGSYMKIQLTCGNRQYTEESYYNPSEGDTFTERMYFYDLQPGDYAMSFLSSDRI